jgi:succinate dehydrogenase hydrophobic anchor subunit
MAVEARRIAPEQPPVPRQRPAGFELWTWLFMRLSGIVLLFLAVGHVLIMHVLEDGVQRVNYDFVAVRRPGWRLAWNSFFGIVGVTLFALGTIIVFTFDPSQFRM